MLDTYLSSPRYPLKVLLFMSLMSQWFTGNGFDIGSQAKGWGVAVPLPKLLDV